MNAETRPFAADTHSGLLRKDNEDCFLAEPELGLWLIADGVGGHPCGELASDIVRNTVREQVAAGSTLVESVRAAHGAIIAAADAQPEAKGMGSTVVAALLRGLDYELCWIGDSRAYLWSDRLWQATIDHNMASELLAQNAITAEEASSHPQRHMLTRSLGASGVAPEPGYRSGTLQQGQRILLCSDGLTEEVSDSLIAHLMAEHKTPRAQVDALMSAALDAGGRDNITVVVIDATSSPTEEQVAPQAEATQHSRRSASGGKPNDGKFPVKALLLVSALLLLGLAAALL